MVNCSQLPAGAKRNPDLYQVYKHGELLLYRWLHIAVCVKVIQKEYPLIGKYNKHI